MTRFKIKLTDDHGAFWLSSHKDRLCWNDHPGNAVAYPTHDEARRQLDAYRLVKQQDAPATPDWFPRVKIIRFSNRNGV